MEIKSTWNERERPGSRLGFIQLSTGCAIGIDNVLLGAMTQAFLP